MEKVDPVLPDMVVGWPCEGSRSELSWWGRFLEYGSKVMDQKFRTGIYGRIFCAAAL